MVKAEWEDLLHRETEDFRCLIVICRFFMLWPLAPKGGLALLGEKSAGAAYSRAPLIPSVRPPLRSESIFRGVLATPIARCARSS